MNNIKFWLNLMRAPFLVLTPPCVLLGVGTAAWTHGMVNIWQALLALLGAVAAHVSVNALNEYSDFKSGVDLATEQTAFSGGSGTLPSRPDLAPLALGIGLGSLAITGLVGLYFVAVRGWALLPLGLLGVVLVVAYTPWITRLPLPCAIATGLGFGTVMVNGTNFALTGKYTGTAFIASFVPFFLLNALLLANHIPDAEIDKAAGRRNLPILVGKRTSSLIYGVVLAAVYLSIVLGVCLGLLPTASLLGLLMVPLAVMAALGVYRYAENTEKLAPYLGYDFWLNVATPLLAAIGLFIAT